MRVDDHHIGTPKTGKMIRKLAQPPQNRNGEDGKGHHTKDDSFY
jgi:hypothetical protein